MRLIDIPDSATLTKALEELVADNHPIVPEPDWNDREFVVGIRAKAVGANIHSHFDLAVLIVNTRIWYPTADFRMASHLAIFGSIARPIKQCKVRGNFNWASN